MNRKILMIGLAFFGLSANAQNVSVDFEEYDLDNGLHVILHEDHSTPIVGVTVMYHVGSKNENPERTGFAHFFEHLLFEGSENIGRGEFSEYIEKAGGTLNANTSNDRTFYHEVLPSNQLKLGLWLESERMMHANIDTAGIETQREVVKEEKRQRVDNQPYGTMLGEIFQRAYTVHPYKWMPIGSMDHLNAAQRDEFYNFYKKYYIPNNAVLSIAGDFDVKETKALIQAYFGEIKKGEAVKQVSIVEPEMKAEIRDTIYDDIQLPAVIQAYRIPAQGTDDFYAIEMLSKAMSNGESSRLNKTCVEEKEQAMFVGSFPFPSEHPGLSFNFGIANSEVAPDALEASINGEFEKVQNELISERELEKIRNMVENEFLYNFYSVVGIAENLANYHMYLGDANLINTELEKYMSVTREDIQRVAKKYFTKDNRVVLYYLPKDAQ